MNEIEFKLEYESTLPINLKVFYMMELTKSYKITAHYLSISVQKVISVYHAELKRQERINKLNMINLGQLNNYFYSKKNKALLFTGNQDKCVRNYYQGQVSLLNEMIGELNHETD